MINCRTCLSLLLLLLGVQSKAQQSRGRVVLPFNEAWKFARFGSMPDGTFLAEPKKLDEPNFDDSGWRTLNLPHDWGIEGPFRAELPNRTGKLPWGGIGWYRKTFQANADDADKKLYLEFDGSMSGTEVWVNGGYVGAWPYGYSSFRLEITPYVKPGAENTVAVRLDNKPNSSRWYPGGGIYRSVRLVKTHPTAFDHWGVFVTTPVIEADVADIHIQAELLGDTKGVEIRHEISEKGNKLILAKTTHAPGTDATILLSKPKRWDTQSPHLYTLTSYLYRGEELLDTYSTTFGVREIEYTADGFFLNGKKTKFNGVCLHHDLGPLGIAVNRRAIQRQLEIVKSYGTNAIRTAHNPPAPEFLELCDEMGILVQVEAFDCWRKSKTENDYGNHFAAWHEKDLRNMVKRDRNHPSVVMWSIGNEIPEFSSGNEAALGFCLKDIVRSYDDTRPVTFGNNRPFAAKNGFQQVPDVFGFNYKPHLYEEFRQNNPDMPLYGSETASTVSSRGAYFFPVEDDKSKGAGGLFQVSSYDLTAPRWASSPEAEWEKQDALPYLMGEFVWTGFDYLGEPTPFNKDQTNLLNYSNEADRERVKKELAKIGDHIPPRSSYFGIVDLCGFPKDRYYLYQAKWRPNFPMVHILPHWNWPERVGEVTPVFVYTSGDEAELFLNGQSLGRRKKEPYQYRLRWNDVVYQPGKLEVKAYKNGQLWATETVETTGEAQKLVLEADRSTIDADGQDLSFVTVKICDKKGVLVPRTHHPITYTLEGPGEIIAVGNGDPTSLESFQATERKAFNGLALVVIRSKKEISGNILLKAESEGLEAETLTIATK